MNAVRGDGVAATEAAGRVGQQLGDGPAVVGNARRHGGCLSPTLDGERTMEAAEVVERTDQIEPALDTHLRACQTARAAREGRQPTTHRAVEAFDEGGVEHLAGGCAPQERQKLAHCAVPQPVAGAADGSSRVLLDHLCDHQLRPELPPWPPACAGHLAAEGTIRRPHIAPQAVTDEQQRAGQRGARHQGQQAVDQGAIAMGADYPAQPEARADHQRHRHPQHLPLRLETHLIGLHLLQLTGLEHLLFMEGFAVRPGRLDPVAHRRRLHAKGRLHRRNRATMADQCHHPRDRLFVRASTEVDRACSTTEGPAADRAPVAQWLATVNPDVALPALSSCRTLLLRAKYLRRTHWPLLVFGDIQ